MSRNGSLYITVNLGLHNGIHFVLILVSKTQFVGGIYCKRVVQGVLIHGCVTCSMIERFADFDLVRTFARLFPFLNILMRHNHEHVTF